MKEPITKMEKEAIYTHLLFVIICLIIILIPLGIGIGLKLFILVVIYNVLVGIVGFWQKYELWIDIWLYVLILSIFQLFPDWFLSAELGILVFPDDGFIKIGTVSLYMAGLWTIPLFLIIYTGLKINERYSKLITYITVGLLSLLIFGLAEQTMWMLQSWYAQKVAMIGHLALYIIIPEIILGLTSYYCFKLIREKNHLMKIPVTFIVMLIYLGSAVLFFFIFERIVFP